MTTIVTVDFHGDQLCAVEQDGEVFVALRPIAETFGLSWSGQFERVQRTPVLARAVRKIRTPSIAGGQEMVCLTLKRLPMWLATIQPGSIKDKRVRERVELYQEECAAVLERHFFGDRTDENRRYGPPDGPTIAEQYASASLAERRRHVNTVATIWGAAAARAVYRRLGMLMVDEMTAPDPQRHMRELWDGPTIDGARVPAAEGREVRQ